MTLRSSRSRVIAFLACSPLRPRTTSGHRPGALRGLIGAVATSLLFAVGSPAVAGPTLIVENGLLVGADQVDVGGSFYNVRFVDGTCMALFNGCQSSSDFTFTDDRQAQLAAQALLTTVLIDGPSGMFSKSPQLTRGCENAGPANECALFVLQGVEQLTGYVGFFGYGAFNEGDMASSFTTTIGSYQIDRDSTGQTDPDYVFAIFSAVPSTTVPEPSSIALLGGGVLAGALLALRRRRKSFTTIVRIALGSLVFAGGTAASAAPTLIVDNNGILTGANNVSVDGSLYDVTFVDGTCIALFNGCDSQSDFIFPTFEDGYFAALALLRTVFVNGPAGAFDADPSLTRGCETFSYYCFVLIPVDNEYLPEAAAANAMGTSGNYVDEPNKDRSFDTSSGDPGEGIEYTYAVFTKVTPNTVPEPSSIALLGCGALAAALLALRRRRKSFTTIVRIALGSLVFAGVTAASAAPTLIVENGILTGANNVSVDGSLYDVSFMPGSCVSLFNGCVTSAFTFHDLDSAVAASQALLDTVFVDGPAGLFDTDPNLTRGCSAAPDIFSCIVVTPYDRIAVYIQFSEALNFIDNDEDGVFRIQPEVLVGQEFPVAGNVNAVFAVFSAVPTAAVPEPDTFALLSTGVLMAFLGIRRRKRREAVDVESCATRLCASAFHHRGAVRAASTSADHCWA